MPVCPSCNLQTSEPDALFCAQCGFALPDGSDGSQESPATFTAGEAQLAFDRFATRPWRTVALSSQPDPRAVAVGLGALAAAVVLAIWLSYGPGSTPAGHTTRLPAASGGVHTRVAHARARPPVNVEHYRAGGYAFAYPSGWSVGQSDRPVSSYRETVLHRVDGAAKVTIDYSPGERIEPAAKASQVEAPTSITRGYRQISFRPTSIRGHPAFVWAFEVADADPRRVDLFLRTRSGGFAILAHGSDLESATSAARFIAGSLRGV